MDPIRIVTEVEAGLQTVWNCWTMPEHITGWNFAHESWHCPSASNDVRVGGTLAAVMAARDGSFQFEFGGIYTRVEPLKHLAFTLSDGRRVDVVFEAVAQKTRVTETFDPETENPRELQEQGWQSILNNFKAYTERFSAGNT